MKMQILKRQSGYGSYGENRICNNENRGRVYSKHDNFTQMKAIRINELRLFSCHIR